MTFRGGSFYAHVWFCTSNLFLSRERGNRYVRNSKTLARTLRQHRTWRRNSPPLPPPKKTVGLRKRSFTLECPHRLFRHQFREIGFFFRHGAIMRAVCRRLGVGHFVDFPSNGGLKPPFFLWSIRAIKFKFVRMFALSFRSFSKLLAICRTDSLLIFVYPTYYVVAQKTHYF